ncbi:MAG TPA: class II aldolase/adducin family protein [Methylomirabilota bacterium]|jgi:ribulose-5-phosphate 4-epimerase/fuculose-1-phosphate aldolase|nr:class II aldolase/adducin family protein [Methylomirabilota bacterium]
MAATTALRRWTTEERAARVELAACYRLIAHFRMTDLVYTHISARVPGTEHFLLNPYGLLFEEVTASNLVRIDIEGQIVEDTPYEVNPAGFTIHSAIHRARPDVNCVLHTHTRAGMAVSCMREGLLPLSQIALQFYGRLAYHDYEGIALDLDERERLERDLGQRKAMILRNHGLLTVGESVPEAFSLMFYLERACEIQIAALSTGRELIQPSPEVCEKTAQQHEGGEEPAGVREWRALVRQLDKADPSYRT